ncbi:hypothetical protein [Alloactinosynnema sp. L-07]|uniref:hypothetical protein n=1 Tax=Alloactinosynnema sp. L-07 TaxID=1653480 RepID=UPI0012F8C544|nr:hypothetical protein [Alloactinosynnema sp. L-07]
MLPTSPTIEFEDVPAASERRALDGLDLPPARLAESGATGGPVCNVSAERAPNQRHVVGVVGRGVEGVPRNPLPRVHQALAGRPQPQHLLPDSASPMPLS